MEVWRILPTVLLFALACNLDTVLLAMGYAARGVALTPRHSLIIAAVTTAVTWFSLVLGDAAALVLPPGVAEALGNLVLVGLGFWCVLDFLRAPGPAPEADQPPAATSSWGWVSLAAALAVNNAGIGAATGAAGLSPLWAALGTFAVTLAALPLGRLLGGRVAGRLLGRFALPLSGGLLMLLGAGRLLG